jgi:hypothetical protein
MSFLKKAFSAAALGMVLIGVATPSQATVVYNSWNSNESPNGNYVLNVTKVGNQFNWNLTVSPWNAEALGLFVDLGAVTIGSVGLSSVSPAGQVSVFATDTSNDSCGSGCNLNGLNSLPALGGGDWELVFSLGDQGWDAIQTFSWTTNDFGLTEAAFGTVAVRAQQLCSGTAVLPGGNCGGSDKAWGTPVDEELPPTGGTVPEPMSAGLVGLGLLAAAAARRRRV